MLLSTRIALIVSLTFAVAFAALVAIGLQREALATRPYSQSAIVGQEALWREILLQETGRLGEILDEIGSGDGFAAAARAGDLATLRRLGTVLTRPLMMSGELSDLQILDAQGQVVYASSALAEPPPLLDVSTIGAVLAGAGLAGMRQVSPEDFRIAAAARFEPWNGRETVLVVGSEAGQPLRRFAAALEAESYLVGTRGRLVEGTDPGLWSELGLALPQRVGAVRQAALGERLFSVTSIALADISAGSAGLLVSVQDATESLQGLRRLTTLSFAIMGAVAALTAAGVYLYLRASFAPLRRAVGILGALSRGDMSATLPAHGDDEIGQIASAIVKLRQSLSALNETGRQRELQRRRQERFVRRQMEALAETLEPGAREEVLSDLGRIVAATRGGGEAGADADPLARLIREDDQLGPIAAVLQQMSGRVVEQHRRLSELVARLREALVRETRLASLQQELAIARDLQHSVLPADLADRPGYSVKGLMESAQEVGGDFYDFFERADGRLAFVIADVSGKGVPAAFFMAIARTLLKAIALFESDPALCVRQLNDLLCVDNERMMFVTLIFGVFDPASGRVELVNAGHLPPIRVAPGRRPELLPTPGDVAIGIAESLDYSRQQLDLAPGETLVLYTDGVTEAFDASGEQYGETRLLDRLAVAGAADGPRLLTERVLVAVKAFEEGVARSDDITLLAIQYTGGGPAA